MFLVLDLLDGHRPIHFISDLLDGHRPIHFIHGHRPRPHARGMTATGHGHRQRDDGHRPSNHGSRFFLSKDKKEMKKR